uniref:CACTA en-spm transposon protein n=1 Tax=Rhabditophanes sp. KR3021 TaxID=114890 RepID=A0AC35U443_9BILA
MTDIQTSTSPPLEECCEKFVSSARSGRRNAMHEYSIEHMEASAHGLTARMGELDTEEGAGPSNGGNRGQDSESGKNSDTLTIS